MARGPTPPSKGPKRLNFKIEYFCTCKVNQLTSMYSFHLKFSSTVPLILWSFIYIPLVGGGVPRGGCRGGVPNYFSPKYRFGALFGPNEVLEMHLAPVLDMKILRDGPFKGAF